MTQITMQLRCQRCHRLIAANLVPGRDGQALHLYAHVDLASLAAAGSAAGGSLTCHPDGTSTAVSPDGRTLHSHSPPCRAA